MANKGNKVPCIQTNISKQISGSGVPGHDASSPGVKTFLDQEAVRLKRHAVFNMNSEANLDLGGMPTTAATTLSSQNQVHFNNHKKTKSTRANSMIPVEALELVDNARAALYHRESRDRLVAAGGMKSGSLRPSALPSASGLKNPTTDSLGCSNTLFGMGRQ